MSEMIHVPGSLLSHRRALPLIILLSGMVLSVMVFYKVAAWEEQRARSDLLQAVEKQNAAHNNEEWQKRWAPAHAPKLSARAWQPWTVLGACLLLTFISTGYLTFILNRAKQVEQIVKIRTEELRQSNERLSREIAAREKAEEELRKVRDELEERVKVRTQELSHANELLDLYAAELGRSNSELHNFAYTVSHDLQEPLRMVTNYLQLLDTRYKSVLDDQARSYINQAVGGAARMRAMILGLLAYSRVQTRGEPFSSIESEIILADALTNLQVSVEESAATITHDPLPVLKADKTQLIQLFQNLIGNSIKFRSQELPSIHVSAEQAEGGWIFSVKDNGIGIDSRHKEWIFKLFHRLHREKYPGDGIGLAICKKIVERHGGRIWIESEPGKGSVFFFSLPASPDGEAAIG